MHYAIGATHPGIFSSSAVAGDGDATLGDDAMEM
jgi:hypothetical protein